ncbi:CatB-related O-acetyltransferase [Myroides guanonis]|uniref:Acetyltransferase (Isoleucine patch superfamily) n=1 Tax=Myroides guanonis TaxID=1150112 RepID=A0A1I3L487_9FLAO|nr:CatB-related O-acetyltransferase [Myroides guanonis]SFI79523.1 Acetyltransferase (isoleucine patch superfamily) [Myroides guanonis]
MRKYYFLILYILRIPLNYIKKNRIHYSTRVSNNNKISNTCIGKYCYLACNIVMNNTNIGNYCSIAPGVQIGGMEHPFWWHSTSTFLSNKAIANKKTNIGNDVWIAAGSIIKQGVTIGDGSVIGAMSFVNKDVPPNSIVFGNPAKFYKERMPPDIFNHLKDSEFWLKDPIDAKKILENI